MLQIRLTMSMTLVREGTKDHTHTKIANDYTIRQPTVINVFAISVFVSSV